MANRREYEMLFSLSARADGSFASAFGKAQEQLANMQKEIGALSKLQSDISAYEKQQSAVAASRRELESLERQYANIQRELEETSGFSSALANEMEQKRLRIDKASDALGTQTDKLDKMGAALQKAGIDMGDLGKASEDLKAKTEELRREQQEAAEKSRQFGEAAAKAFSTVQQALAAAGILLALKAVYGYFADSARAAMEFEQAMAGVRRTVGGTEAELSHISAEFRAMATSIPITTTELGKIAEGAEQLGIAREDVLEFTRIMAMLGIATDLTADNAATMLAQFANITGLDPKDYSRLGSTVAALDDATATTASKVVDMSQGIAGAATIAGMSEVDILGISAAVGSLGIEAQAGGTAMSSLIQTLHSAAETGKGLEEFAAIANMSAEEFSHAWGTNAVGAMDSFIQGLNDVERNGRSSIVILDELGITNVRQVRAVQGLANAGSLLSDTIAQGNRAWSENAAIQEKADTMYGTTASKLVMMQSAYNNLKIAIGENYAPALQQAYAAGTDLLTGLTAIIERNPALVKGVTAAVGVFGGATAAATGFAAALKLLTAAKAALAGATSLALGPMVALAAGAATLVGVHVALKSAISHADEEALHLTQTSREQYFQMKELNTEYERAASKYGEASEEAKRLRWEHELLSAEFERGKKTAEQFSREVEAAANANAGLISSHREAIDEIGKQEHTALSLAGTLEELVRSSDGTAASQDRIKATVDALNKALPELNLNYGDAISGGAGFARNIRQIAEAEASRQRNQRNYSTYVDLISALPDLEHKHALALSERESAQARLNAASEAYNRLLRGSDASRTDLQHTAEYAEYAAAKAAAESYAAALDSTTQAAEENRRAQEELQAQMEGYSEAAESASASSSEYASFIGELTGLMELKEAYGASYDAALQSIQGQYKIWDEAAQVIPMSIDDVLSAMESQQKYWDEYTANIGILTGKAAEIEGLGALLSGIADGTPQSARLIAAMAEVNNAKLEEMVRAHEALQESQGDTASSMADLETEFTESMLRIQQSLEESASKMDLGKEAYEAGLNTVQSFITGSERMLPQVQAAYSKIAEAVQRGLNAGSGSIGMTVGLSGQINASAARGLDYVPFDGFIAELHKGERVLTAQEAAAADDLAKSAGPDAGLLLVSMAPQLASALQQQAAVPIAATAEPARQGAAQVSFDITFNIDAAAVEDSGALRETLREAADELAEAVLGKLDERGIDMARMAYR